jgi:hypothetical protein
LQLPYKILFIKPAGKRTLGRSRHIRWEDNIKIHVKEIRCEGWTGLILFRIRTYGRLCEHGNEILGSVKGGEFLDKLSDC